MSTFEVITLAYGIFVAGIFLYFWLMSKAIQTMTAIAWDTIPGVSLRGHRARWLRLYSIYMPYVLGYVVVAFAAGFAELHVAELCDVAGPATLARLFAFIMLVIAAASIVMNIPTSLSIVQTIRDDEKAHRAQVS
jgi:hypothetical protein